ncbi:MAG TPA: cyclic pyranopterin monophosphate synthase MoaC [Elusimicrobia bacterium]|jgi:cyclic pyranopterin phosphate synthase|nr:cyclic pyranopterin monophosphate synthase MoaC [Elusimicrobiota bacterium]
MEGLSHFDNKGKARMVDVSEKKETLRIAKAQAIVRIKKETMDLIKKNKVAKGDCFAVAKIAGILAAKKVAELIPLTHPLKISHCDIEFIIADYPDVTSGQMTRIKNLCTIKILANVKTKDITGVEMEALTAVAIAGLTIYDMVKAVDRGTVISDICLLEKKGGESGYWKRRKAK